MGKSCPGGPGHPSPGVTLGAPTIHMFLYKSKRVLIHDQKTTCLGERGEGGGGGGCEPRWQGHSVDEIG